jgi:hypothetical protein
MSASSGSAFTLAVLVGTIRRPLKSTEGADVGRRGGGEDDGTRAAEADGAGGTSGSTFTVGTADGVINLPAKSTAMRRYGTLGARVGTGDGGTELGEGKLLEDGRGKELGEGRLPEEADVVGDGTDGR